MLTLLIFIGLTALVAFLTYYFTKDSSLGSQDGYFLAGRTLTAPLIAGSLMLTNLSAINFAGMSAQSYDFNMAVMGWEVFSGLTLALVAIFLLPRYLKAGLTTIPEFLEDRFSPQVKQWVTILFLFLYVSNGLPVTLYAGSIILGQLFNVSELFGISHTAGIWLMVWALGIIGSLYAIFGGLKAIALSDTINGIGLLVGGLLIPYFGLKAVGDGNLFNGMVDLVQSHPEKFDSIGSATDPLPFSTIFTGLLLVNLYYWGTDQGIIQRALGAKNLEEGQKGIMMAGFLKILTPLILIIPGIIAFRLYGTDAGIESDLMYAHLIRNEVPVILVGFLAAVMFGATLSSFNSTLNSSATLFSLNIFNERSGVERSEAELVKIGKRISIILAVIAMCIAPLIMYAEDGLFQHLQVINGLFNVPIFTIVFMGYATKRVPTIAAKAGLIFFVSAYAILQFIVKPDLHFLHQLAILFALTCIIMLIIGKLRPREEAYVLKEKNKVVIIPWKYVKEAGAIVIAIMFNFFILFSKLGLAGGTWQSFGIATLILWMLTALAVFLIFKSNKNRKLGL